MDKKMDSKKLINLAMIIALVVIVGGVSFFAGTKINRGKGMGNFVDFSPQERQNRMQAGGQRGTNSGFIAGEILSKDDKSITVKLPDGGSKIILFSASTKITKSTAGSLDDLKAGENVTAIGSANADGSVTAQSIEMGMDIPTEVKK